MDTKVNLTKPQSDTYCQGYGQHTFPQLSDEAFDRVGFDLQDLLMDNDLLTLSMVITGL